MAIDARVSRKAGAVALIAAAGVSLTSIPAAANGATARQPAAGVQAPTDPGTARLPSGLSALSWMVADADTGNVLAAKSPHRKLAPASTLKTLFAVTVLPKFSAGTVRRVSSADLAGVGAGSSVVGVRQGGRYTVGDLWRGVFLRSGNDAVHVLAAMNGGWRTTAEEMQETARKLGARDTTVKSPDGYDAPGQVSSAHDLTVFARAGLANEDFARYCATTRATFPGAGGATRIENTNRLLAGSHGMSRYPGIIGVKNGYTSKAGNTLIAAARRNGRTLLVTVLNPQSQAYNGVYKEAAALLDWGFRTAGTAQPVGTLHAVRAIDDGAGPMSPVAAEVTGAQARGGSPWRTTLVLGAGVAGVAALGLGPLLAKWRQARGRGGRRGGAA
ncbi:D-alanyl-D-alanine carboxypeptidase family protein [Streptomyces platensis]|uniref:D-alanyl-D-alanine carboxypeptidase family protein n=1 Tax=Streptomyces platensis TaxID=58346 RepID=UPI001F3E0051|nr:serine hydrolase [Streptomyces platensis]MCF3146457.1 D-alanyl-D-alanine carboxypeptidase [Streptomyces platensis]